MLVRQILELAIFDDPPTPLQAPATRHPSMGAATAPPTPESPNSRAHGEASYDTQERIASLFSRSAASSSSAAGAGASGSVGALRAA